jgi:hypothetical protein
MSNTTVRIYFKRCSWFYCHLFYFISFELLCSYIWLFVALTISFHFILFIILNPQNSDLCLLLFILIYTNEYLLFYYDNWMTCVFFSLMCMCLRVYVAAVILEYYFFGSGVTNSLIFPKNMHNNGEIVMLMSHEHK